jgi:3-methyladenine DNA glycosylase AlkD
MKKPHYHVQGIYEIFRESSDPKRADPMKKYMRDRFDFFGITAPERKMISSAFLSENKVNGHDELITIAIQLWKLPERECQYYALDLLMKKVKLLDRSDTTFIEQLITTKSWWDTVDALASNVAGPWLKANQSLIKPITLSWNQSENFWLQRSSLLFQLKYKHNTDVVLMKKYILRLAGSKEFFIQKAIGWLLREYSKTNAEWVREFADNHPLAPLSKREALKRIGH